MKWGLPEETRPLATLGPSVQTCGWIAKIGVSRCGRFAACDMVSGCDGPGRFVCGCLFRLGDSHSPQLQDVDRSSTSSAARLSSSAVLESSVSSSPSGSRTVSQTLAGAPALPNTTARKRPQCPSTDTTAKVAGSVSRGQYGTCEISRP